MTTASSPFLRRTAAVQAIDPGRRGTRRPARLSPRRRAATRATMRERRRRARLGTALAGRALLFSPVQTLEPRSGRGERERPGPLTTKSHMYMLCLTCVRLLRHTFGGRRVDRCRHGVAACPEPDARVRGLMYDEMCRWLCRCTHCTSERTGASARVGGVHPASPSRSTRLRTGLALRLYALGSDV
eukprot:1412294-Prymnesium_polylepis.1